MLVLDEKVIDAMNRKEYELIKAFQITIKNVTEELRNT